MLTTAVESMPGGGGYSHFLNENIYIGRLFIFKELKKKVYKASAGDLNLYFTRKYPKGQ